MRQTRTGSEQHAVEDAVMASEIEQLPDLSGFLKSKKGRLLGKLTIRHRDAIAAAWMACGPP
jgi:hypothetical protein